MQTMTLVKPTMEVTGEQYETIITDLDLQEDFKHVTNSSIDEFDIQNSSYIGSELLVKVLEHSSRRFWYDRPDTGSSPRYRILEFEPK